MRNEDEFGELDMMQPSLNPGAKKPGAYEIAGTPGSELLGKGEGDICRMQRIAPLGVSPKFIMCEWFCTLTSFAPSPRDFRLHRG